MYRKCMKTRAGPGIEDIGQHLPREAKRDGAGDIRLQKPRPEEPGTGLRHFRLQQTICRGELAVNPIEPWLVLLLGGSQIVLEDDLNRLLADR